MQNGNEVNFYLFDATLFKYSIATDVLIVRCFGFTGSMKYSLQLERKCM